MTLVTKDAEIVCLIRFNPLTFWLIKSTVALAFLSIFSLSFRPLLVLTCVLEEFYYLTSSQFLSFKVSKRSLLSSYLNLRFFRLDEVV